MQVPHLVNKIMIKKEVKMRMQFFAKIFSAFRARVNAENTKLIEM